MPGSRYQWQVYQGFWPKALAAPAIQAVILLVLSMAVIFGVDRALGSRQLAARSVVTAPSPGDCPQAAETFDRQRAACLRRRWSAMRQMQQWPEAQNALLENCLRSPQGEIVTPFKTNSCGAQNRTAAAGKK